MEIALQRRRHAPHARGLRTLQVRPQSARAVCGRSAGPAPAGKPGQAVRDCNFWRKINGFVI
jgi:hypothetical protein